MLLYEHKVLGQGWSYVEDYVGRTLAQSVEEFFILYNMLTFLPVNSPHQFNYYLIKSYYVNLKVVLHPLTTPNVAFLVVLGRGRTM
jgi:hypothetical protein